MSLDLKPILERERAATKGPWTQRGRVFVDEPKSSKSSYAHNEANAAFIASARTDIPALCAEVEALRALLRRAGVEMNPHASDSLGAPWELLNDIDSALPPVSP